MAKYIEIQIDDVSAVARLNEEAAPQTAARFWEALPIEETLRHVRWSGMAGYVLVDRLRDPAMPLENRVSFYQPGTINLRPEGGEIAFSYGQGQARDVTGNHWATNLATVEGDAAPYLAAVAQTKRGGGKKITIRKREG